ncbi:MAG: hypothetical protein GQ565_03055 [Candidatus Aegiribacteria sp.]|nr:hypothetical protein [Candidatus Aegiribacteria sp.]
MKSEPTIGRLATTIVTTLIGMHGLAKAYEIGNRINEQILSQVKRQIAKHPDEWSDRIKREIPGDACDHLATSFYTAATYDDVPPAPTI